MRVFTPAEAALLLRLQSAFPLEERPFRAIGETLGLTEKETLETVVRLKDEGIIRDITGIFNAHRLGYHTALAAFRVPQADLERAAGIVSSHSGVSHNYGRAHEYNLWFTIAVERGVPLEKEVEALARLAGVGDWILLRNERTLKIGVILPVGDGRPRGVPITTPGAAGSALPPDPAVYSGDARAGKPSPAPLSPEEREAVRVLQRDLPIESEAFGALLRESGSSLGDGRLLPASRRFRDTGVMRRYAAVLRHRRAGFAGNVMSVWRWPEGSEDSFLPFLEEPLVTHLYLRVPVRGEWRHNLFAMLHGRTPEEADILVRDLARRSGLADYLVLPSLREFKKKKITYLGEPFSLLKGSRL